MFLVFSLVLLTDQKRYLIKLKFAHLLNSYSYKNVKQFLFLILDKN